MKARAQRLRVGISSLSVAAVITGILEIETVMSQDHWRPTTLSIAHRIQTVMDSDRVMMLDAGRIVEFGVPTALADQPNSRLAQLLAANSAP